MLWVTLVTGEQKVFLIFLVSHNTYLNFTKAEIYLKIYI